MTYETKSQAESARNARPDSGCFYVYQMSDGFWALGRYAGRATGSGYAVSERDEEKAAAAGRRAAAAYLAGDSLG
jgi:hypothetical protein